jgi:2-iminobutanoate/2-iminopropanoate deaminase
VTGTLPFAAWRAAGGLVATAGIAALDPATRTPLHPDFDTQAHWVLDRLDAVLAEAGTHRDALLRLECFLADRADFAAWSAVFAEHFVGGPMPARTTLVSTLPVPGLLIEVQGLCVAEHSAVTIP